MVPHQSPENGNNLDLQNSGLPSMDNINREATNLRNLSEQFKHARLNIQYGASVITPNGNIGPLNHLNERGRSP
jgi:hypothetical protein